MFDFAVALNERSRTHGWIIRVAPSLDLGIIIYKINEKGD
jgi:hypothetical protein